MICGDKMVEKLVEIGILFDFYGKLLSDRQYSAIELYYIHDLSLGEIGDELNITRQGVFDTLKRGEQKLYEYEEKLNLVKKFYSSHKNIKEIINISQDIIEELDNIEGHNIKEKIEEKILLIEKVSNNILNNSQEV